MALVARAGCCSRIVGNGGAKTTVPDLLILDPVGAFDHPDIRDVAARRPRRGSSSSSSGSIKLVKSTGTTDFMTVPNVFGAAATRPALSMAFSPGLRDERALLLSTAWTDDGAIQVDEFHRGRVEHPDHRRPGAPRRAVITVLHPGQSNHNGGQLEFGPDGMLYMGTGDGGAAAIRSGRARTSQELRGKILRIDPRQNGADPYAVPANNRSSRPGALEAGDLGTASATTWRLLVRPRERRLAPSATWVRTSGRRSTTARSTWGGARRELGWSCMEARHLYGNCPEPPNHTPPVYEYNHNIGAVLDHGRLRRT